MVAPRRAWPETKEGDGNEMRSRNLKPGFFTNPVLLAMPPTTRILFLGLGALCDRRGLLFDRPMWIKRHVLPADPVDVNLALADMDSMTDDDGTTLITRYVDSVGTRAIKINKFLRHNAPHYKEEANPEILDIGEKPGANPGPARGQPGDFVQPSAVYPGPARGQPGASPGPALDKAPIVGGLPPLNPESCILNPESGILNPESCALAQSDARAHEGQHEPEPEPEANPSDVASVVRLLAGSTAMGRDPTPTSPAHEAARALALHRQALDNVFSVEPVIDPWALSLSRLHHHGKRPWEEITEVMRWAFDESGWWGPRVLNAWDFVKNYDRIRSQWQAAQQEPAEPEAATDPQHMRSIYESLAFEVSEGGADVAAAWIERQPAKLHPRLRKRLAAIAGAAEANP